MLLAVSFSVSLIYAVRAFFFYPQSSDKSKTRCLVPGTVPASRGARRLVTQLSPSSPSSASLHRRDSLRAHNFASFVHVWEVAAHFEEGMETKCSVSWPFWTLDG